MEHIYYKDIIDVNKSVFNNEGRIVKAFIKDGVTDIGNIAFYGCNALTDVVMGNKVVSIGVRAFFGCISLTHITIPNSVKSIGTSAFRDCSSLTRVTIGKSVKSIGKYAFSGCESLTDVTIPDSVTSIGENAFYGCERITNITIPGSVTRIENGAFDGCWNLKNHSNRFFKITNADMSCRNRHYKINKWYYLKGKIELCHNGFHACRKPTECFNYYCGDVSKLRFFEVKLGDIIDEDCLISKVVSDRIKFIREYTLKEFIELANNVEE